MALCHFVKHIALQTLCTHLCQNHFFFTLSAFIIHSTLYYLFFRGSGNTSYFIRLTWGIFVLVEDVTPPSLKWVGQLPTQTIGSVALSWTTDEAVTSVCSVDSPIKTVNVSCSNRWVGTNLRDGEHCLTVMMVDGSGNKAEAKYRWNNSKDFYYKWFLTLTNTCINLDHSYVKKVYIIVS